MAWAKKCNTRLVGAVARPSERALLFKVTTDALSHTVGLLPRTSLSSTAPCRDFQTTAGQRFPQLASLTPRTAVASVLRICAVFSNKLFGVISSRQVQIFGDETHPRLLFVFSPAGSQMIAVLRVILATLFAAPAKREQESSR